MAAFSALATAAAAALLLLSGCLNRSSVPSPAAPAPLILEFWDFPHLPETNEWIARCIAGFEAEHGGQVKVRFTRLPWQDGQQKVMLSVLAGRPPDVCGQVNVSPMFIAQQALEPLEQFLSAKDRADFYPSYLEAVSYGGHLWAIPYYKACYVVLLNLDVFEARGVRPPQTGQGWTWEEFRETCRRLTGPADAARGLPAPTWGLATNLGPMEYEAYTILSNAGGRVLRRMPSGEVRNGVREPEFITGLGRLQALEFEDKSAVPGLGAMTQEQSWNLFRDSRAVGITFQGAWCVTALRRLNAGIEARNAQAAGAGRRPNAGQRPLRWALAQPPAPRGTTPTLCSSGLGTYVLFRQPLGRGAPAHAEAERTRRRQLAAELALRLTAPGDGQRVLRGENAWPSRRSTGDLWAQEPALQPVFALFAEGVLTPLMPGTDRLDRVLQNELQRALLRDPATGKPQATAQAAAQAAAEKVDAILARAARE